MDNTTSWSPSWSITPTLAPLVMNGQNSSECLDNCNENNISYSRFVAGTLIFLFAVLVYFIKYWSMRRRLEEDIPNARPSATVAGPPTPNALLNSNNHSAAGGMSLSQRNLFVTQLLPTKLFNASGICKSGGVDWEPRASTELSSLPPPENMAVSTIPHGHKDDEEKEQKQSIQVKSSVTPENRPAPMSSVVKQLPVRECAVCLEAFCQNDEICTSNNPECPHVFHVNCMHSWLLRQEECPCCRRPYLQGLPSKKSYSSRSE